MQRYLRPVLFLLALWLLVTASRSAEIDPALFSRPDLQTPAPTGRVVLQFEPTATADDHARITALAGARPEPRFSPALLAGPAGGKRLAHGARDELSRFAHLDAPDLPRDDLLRLVRRLAADPAVALAFLEPRAVPAALGFDAFTGSYTPGPPGSGPLTTADKSTPDFTGLQGYLEDAPLGIGAATMSIQPGARGGSVGIIDVEGAWLWTHEDLPTPLADIGAHYDDVGWRNHGTAVVGVMRGSDNGYGVIGIVPDCAVGSSSIGDQSVAGALLSAAAALEPGDLILIELHAPGPNSYEGGGQFGYLPMEYWPDNFATIRALTDQGLIIVEAAGNGQQDLDDPIYQDLFDRQVRDSGAIMVGATDGGLLVPAWFTNHGARVDLCGWGYEVTTTGYGDLQAGPETEWYTEQFAGTSSASPVVTGAVASLQGMVEAAYGLSIDAQLAVSLLRGTGTPTEGPQLIGPRPDLVAAWAAAAPGVGRIDGVVTEQGTGLPLAEVQVRILPDGPTTTTAGDGSYGFALLPGIYDLEFSSYFHATRSDAVTVASGPNAHDTALEPLPLVAVAGTVLGADQTPLAGVRLAFVGEQLPESISGPGGAFSLPALPVGRSYLLLAGGAPGHGGRTAAFTVAQGAPDLVVALPPATHDFEAGDDGYTATGGLWQRGDPSVHGVGPGAAFAGQSCWGVGLDGAGYPNGGWSELRSPLFDGGSFAGDELYLSFHYWCGTEAGWDGVQVVLDPDGDATVIQPLDGYTDSSLLGLGYLPGWSGTSDGWRTAIFDVTGQLAEPAWRFALRFGSDEYVTDAGFLVDGVTLHAVDTTVGVADLATPPAAAASLAAWPNPFNPRVTLAWSLPAPGRVDLDVVDLRGRVVRRLLQGEAVAAAGRLAWDGTDQLGRSLPSGVYLARLRPQDGPPAVQRLLLGR